MFGAKARRIRNLRAEVKQAWEARHFWADSWQGEWHRHLEDMKKIADLEADLAAEKAKNTAAQGLVITNDSDFPVKIQIDERDGTSTYTVVRAADPEAERVAKLPKCGTTKKCKTCGSTKLRRNIYDLGGAPSHKYLCVQCEECKDGMGQERPLFNSGKAAK